MLLNIGLSLPSGGTLLPAEVRTALLFAGIVPKRIALHQSDTEPTLVVKCANTTRAALQQVAEELEQDCIAVWFENGAGGDLIGPRADAWGSFDRSAFITLDGSRLSN